MNSDLKKISRASKAVDDTKADGSVDFLCIIMLQLRIGCAALFLPPSPAPCCQASLQGAAF